MLTCEKQLHTQTNPETPKRNKKVVNKITWTTSPTQVFSVNCHLQLIFKVYFPIVIYFDFVAIYIFLQDFSVVGPNFMKFKLLVCSFKGLLHLCQPFCYTEFFPFNFFVF